VLVVRGVAHPLACRRLLTHTSHCPEKEENTGEEKDENNARDGNHSELS
jgi:hypothetical protein